MEERKQVSFPTPKHALFGHRIPSKGIFSPHILPSDSWKSAREKRQLFIYLFCDSHLETVLFCNSTLHPSGQSKSAWYWERKGLLCGSKPSYSQLILELIFFSPPGKRAREFIPMFQLGAQDRGPFTCAAGACCHGGLRKMVVSRRW